MFAQRGKLVSSTNNKNCIQHKQNIFYPSDALKSKSAKNNLRNDDKFKFIDHPKTGKNAIQKHFNIVL